MRESDLDHLFDILKKTEEVTTPENVDFAIGAFTDFISFHEKEGVTDSTRELRYILSFLTFTYEDMIKKDMEMLKFTPVGFILANEILDNISKILHNQEIFDSMPEFIRTKYKTPEEMEKMLS